MTALDGYTLLSLSRMQHPDDVYKVCIADKGFTSVNPHDLGEFRDVIYVDASGNRLSLGDMANFPRIEKLYLSLNQISQLNGDDTSVYGRLSHLRLLDLSFNYLRANVFECVGHLRNLVHLDLSNNCISDMIPDNLTTIHHMTCLQTLSLRGNPLNDDRVSLSHLLQSLSQLSSLRQLDLSHCGLVQLPNFYAIHDHHHSPTPFVELSLLNLAHNELSSDSLGPLVQLSTLKYLDLRHNPCVQQVIDGDAVLITDVLVCSCRMVVAIMDPSVSDRADCSHLLQPPSTSAVATDTAPSPSPPPPPPPPPTAAATATAGPSSLTSMITNDAYIPEWVFNEATSDWMVMPTRVRSIDTDMVNNMVRSRQAYTNRDDGKQQRIPSRIRSRLWQLQGTSNARNVITRMHADHKRRQRQHWATTIREISSINNH